MQDLIVLTGVTSGFGALALKTLAEKTDKTLIVGARNVGDVRATYGDRVRAVPLDLASLQSVDQFCAELSSESISILVMNAGMQTRTQSMTEDGFEKTFQVNYLSHFRMFQNLQPRLTDGARVVTTGSGTHDPAEKTPVPAPRHAKVSWLAHPDSNPNRDRLTPVAMARSYSTSKLLCIMMAREIAARYPLLKAVSFDPGYLPDTKLSREYPAVLTSLVKRLIPFMMKNDRTGSSATTAPEYVRVILGDLTPEQNGGYIVMRSGAAMAAEPSELARKPGLSSEIWDASSALM